MASLPLSLEGRISCLLRAVTVAGSSGGSGITMTEGGLLGGELLLAREEVVEVEAVI